MVRVTLDRWVMSRSDLVLVPACLSALVWSVLAVGGSTYPFDGYYEVRSPEGGLLQYRFFKNGKKEGLQRDWTGDGVMTFNYTVKDGRIYGYRGTKECGRQREP
jgi:hypothetical protein